MEEGGGRGEETGDSKTSGDYLDRFRENLSTNFFEEVLRSYKTSVNSGKKISFSLVCLIWRLHNTGLYRVDPLHLNGKIAIILHQHYTDEI